jgi:hypothetical protein
MRHRVAIACLALMGAISAASAGEIVIDFEQADVGKPVPTWTDQGVLFALAGPLAHSKATGRVMNPTRSKAPPNVSRIPAIPTCEVRAG